jgi:hypothetical protein
MEDLVAAAEYNNIQLLTWPGHRSLGAQWPVSEINTAFAGNEFGFGCISGSDSTKRRLQTHNLASKKPWSDNIFSVLFTHNALTAHVSPISCAPHFYAASGIANFSLGLPSDIDSSDSPYWLQIRFALRTALDSYSSRGYELGRVVSYGESANDEVFQSILREEVLAVQWPEHEVEFSSQDTVFAAGRGAAEFARLCPNQYIASGCFPDLTPQRQGW